ncbi:MAG: RNA methyltransferase [Clostridiales bacterium]|nr:RNA methyltransferase [Clostridiales bacterium]
MEIIKSKNNDIIKNTKKLLTSHKFRRESGMFVLEGARLCFDALNSDCEIILFLFTETIEKKYAPQCSAFKERAQKYFKITDEIANKLSDTENAQGIFAVLRIKPSGAMPLNGGKYIAFDCVQNPLNLGAAVRTAEALGAAGAICFNCCDIYNPKALRASMGGMLRLPVFISNNLCEDLRRAQHSGCTVYSAVPDRQAQDIKNVHFSDFSICVIGNEANGVSQNVIDISDQLVTIKMNSAAESLNALSAASIVMWEMTKG